MNQRAISSSDLLGLGLWYGVTFAAAVVGSSASINAGMFYGELVRPAWAPPGWWFGPVWSVLYCLMGLAAFWVWENRKTKNVRSALTLYVAQLVLNGLWTWIFFNWHRGGMAFVEICALWVLILATLISFAKIRLRAGLLLVPYLLWVSFASILTYAMWQLNPGVL